MALAVAQQLREYLEAAEEAAKKDSKAYHAGHEFLLEVAKDIETSEKAATKS